MTVSVFLFIISMYLIVYNDNSTCYNIICTLIFAACHTFVAKYNQNLLSTITISFYY